MIPGMNSMPMPNNMLESEMIGAIKIKDGLFIGDEYASTVSLEILLTLLGQFCFTTDDALDRSPEQI